MADIFDANYVPQNEEELKLRGEERRDRKCECTIINKETGEIVDRAQKYADEAELWCKRQIQHKSWLKYRYYQIV